MRRMNLKYWNHDKNRIQITNTEIYLQNWQYYYAMIRQKEKKWYKRPATNIGILLGLVFALEPGIVRGLFDDRPVTTNATWLPVTFGFIINLFFAVTSQLTFAVLVHERVKDHSNLVERLTKLIEVQDNFQEAASSNVKIVMEKDSVVAGNAGDAVISGVEEKKNDSVSDSKNASDGDQAGRISCIWQGCGNKFVKDDEFLSFDDPENLSSWMEMRDYVYIQGMKLFGDLEGIMVTLIVLTLVLAVYISVDVVSCQGLISETRGARAVMFGISILWVIQVVFLGFKFDEWQQRQVRAINNQRRCILLTYQDTRQGCLQCETWKTFRKMIASEYQLQGHLRRRTVMSDNYNNEVKENDHPNWTPQEIMYQERKFDQHIKTLEFFASQLEARPINPQLFGFGLTGAFMKTFVVSAVGPFIVSLIGYDKCND